MTTSAGLLGAFDIYRGTAQSIYACARTAATIVTVNVTNRGGGVARVSIAITTTRHVALPAEYIEFETPLAPRSSLERMSIFVPAGKFLTIESDTSSVSAQCWGIEQGQPDLLGPSVNTNLGDAPVWVTGSTLSVTALDNTALALTATDTGGYAPNFQITSGTLPNGLTLNAVTGAITGQAADTGYTPGGETTAVTIAATDGGLNIVPQTFNITRQWRDGSSSTLAPTKAQYIKSLTGTTTSGYYWINIANTPTRVWIDMSRPTAWMLAMRCATSPSTTFGFNSAYWQNATGLNDLADPTTNTDIKNGFLWANYGFTNMRVTGSTNTLLFNQNEMLFQGFFSRTLQTVFSEGNNIYDGQINAGRQGWLDWANAACGLGAANWNNQPNCNADSINANYTYHQVRIGISMNNEADCLTNDSGIGIGQWRNGTGELSAGGVIWSPSTNNPTHAAVWVI